MQWPRDADRLPNGHTLVTDSNGNRVFEVDDRGRIVWSVTVAFPYEAERLGTGAESSHGPSATRAGLDSHTVGPVDRALLASKQFVPGRYLNALLYVTPVWMGFPEVAELAVLVVASLLWAGVEAVRWRRTT